MDNKVNDMAPIAIDFVAINNSENLNKLQALTAAKWFEQKNQLLQDNPDTLRVWSLELVPGQHFSTNNVPIKGDKAIALFAYANYLAPGVYRVNLTEKKIVRLIIDAKDIHVLGS